MSQPVEASPTPGQRAHMEEAAQELVAAMVAVGELRFSEVADSDATAIFMAGLRFGRTVGQLEQVEFPATLRGQHADAIVDGCDTQLENETGA